MNIITTGNKTAAKHINPENTNISINIDININKISLIIISCLCLNIRKPLKNFKY